MGIQMLLPSWTNICKSISQKNHKVWREKEKTISNLLLYLFSIDNFSLNTDMWPIFNHVVNHGLHFWRITKIPKSSLLSKSVLDYITPSEDLGWLLAIPFVCMFHLSSPVLISLCPAYVYRTYLKILSPFLENLMCFCSTLTN